ncbi:MAG: GNAT family N-acetyltransferase [Pseudomonadota bacterium]
MQDVILRPFTKADRDWLVRTHQELYTRDEGFDSSFGPLVADILDGFLAEHDPACEAGWIAATGSKRLGSIFCVRLDLETAKLRLFLLSPEARGLGLGKRMLQQCMRFARTSDYRGMQLWTHESHRAACALYRAAGWELVGSKAVHSFGQDLVEQSWRIRF